MSDTSIGAVFVYGTLMPGHLRWSIIEPYVAERWQDMVSGQLYDTGRGYPGARFDEPGRIPGWGLQLDPARLIDAVDLLDEVEGPHLYSRIAVTTGVGRAAWSYRVDLDVADMTPIDAWTRDVEEES